MGPAPKRLRVIVTRARGQLEPLAERIEALGHEVVRCPLIELEPVGPDRIDVDGYDWVVVTSPFGARELLRRARGTLPALAAIGPGTAAALGEAGVDAALVPRVSTQEGLVAELPRPPGRVLFAGAERARGLLVDELGAEFVPLYRTRELRPDPPPEGELVVLASPSAAHAFAALGTDLPAVSIGPETTRAAEAAGVRVVAEADPHDLDGLVAAVARASHEASTRRRRQ
jgi:uroporphyrinogen-III synthase